MLWLPRSLSRSHWDVEVEPVLVGLQRRLLGCPQCRLHPWAWRARDELEPAVLLRHRRVYLLCLRWAEHCMIVGLPAGLPTGLQEWYAGL